MIGNYKFEVVNSWVGWGDPLGGLWTIGIEEGEPFRPELISKMQEYHPFIYTGHYGKEERLHDFGYTVAKIAAPLVNAKWNTYAHNFMWDKGSKVFTGNYYPLGKPGTHTWPDWYKDLFELTRDEYKKNEKFYMNIRIQCFREFRKQQRPQAIVCLGKTLWGKFEKMFVQYPNNFYYPIRGVKVFLKDNVILTYHSSHGWLTNLMIEEIVRTLKKWGVQLPSK